MTDQPQEPEATSSAPDPLAMAVASTAEDYTAEKLTPDPGSAIGRAVDPVAQIEQLPDTAEKPQGPTPPQEVALPDEEGTTAPEAPFERPEPSQPYEQ